MVLSNPQNLCHTRFVSTHNARPSNAILSGGVYWVEVDPGAEGTASPNYRHPHVVVQPDLFNQSRIHSVVVCALTTNLGRVREPGNVLLDEGEADLPKRSVIVVSQISSIAKTQLGAYIGTLSKLRVEQVLDGLRMQQATYFGMQSDR